MPRVEARSPLPSAHCSPEVRFSQEIIEKLFEYLGIVPPSPSPQPARYTKKQHKAFWRKVKTCIKNGKAFPVPQATAAFKILDEIYSAIGNYEGLKVYVDDAVTIAERKAYLDPFIKSCQTTLDLFNTLPVRDIFDDTFTLRSQVESKKESDDYTQMMNRFPVVLKKIMAMISHVIQESPITPNSEKSDRKIPRKLAQRYLIKDLSAIFVRSYNPSGNKQKPELIMRKFIRLILKEIGLPFTDKRLAELLKEPLSL